MPDSRLAEGFKIFKNDNFKVGNYVTFINKTIGVVHRACLFKSVNPP